MSTAPSMLTMHVLLIDCKCAGIPPGPTTVRTPEQVKEHMLAIEAGLSVSLEAAATTEGHEKQLVAARKLRDLLSTNRDQLILELLNRKLVPLLMR
jgi:hypothetical protein